MAFPPEGEVFTVIFHPAMRDRFLLWLRAQGWELGQTPEIPDHYLAVVAEVPDPQSRPTRGPVSYQEGHEDD